MEEIKDIDVEEDEKAATETTLESSDTPTAADKPKLFKLPLARVKHIMKMDPDCNLISQDALFLVTKSTVITFS